MTTPNKTREEWCADICCLVFGKVPTEYEHKHVLRIIDEITVEALEEARGINKACAHREFNERITARINQIKGGQKV